MCKYVQKHAQKVFGASGRDSLRIELQERLKTLRPRGTPFVEHF